MAALTPRERIQLANERMSITQACRFIGMHLGDFEIASVKTYCPFGELLHEDGGRSKAFRVYPETNSAYCVDYETEILTQRGWLSGTDLRINDVVLTFTEGRTQWEALVDIHRFEQAPRRMLSMETKTHSSLTTADHRWIVYPQAARSYRTTETTSRHGFRPSDTVPYGGRCVTLPTSSPFSDSLVELVGWFITEGTLKSSGGRPALVSIYQSHQVNPEYVARIRSALTAEFGPASQRLRAKDALWREDQWGDSGKTTFSLSVSASARLLEIAPSRIIDPSFVALLPEAQLRLLVETAVDGDGARVGNWKQLCQKDPARLDAIQMAATLLGDATHLWSRAQHNEDHALQFLQSRGFRPHYWAEKGMVSWSIQDIPVWCPETPAGTWIARRRGSVFVTGNCFACIKAYRPVSLIATDRDIPEPAAAEVILEETGYVAPNFMAKWEALSDQTASVDRDALEEALKTYCARISPDWEMRQLDDDIASTFRKCLTASRNVASDDDARKWLKLTKQVMAKALQREAG